jgi:hypothetical protein
MRSRVVSAVIAATAMLASACSSSSDSTTEQKPSSAPTSAAASATERAAMRGAPQVGTCWNIPPSGFTAGHHFNESPAVPCTKSHTTETVFVQKLDEPTIKAGNQWIDQCRRAVSTYAGEFHENYWVPVSALLWLPPRKLVAAGASWVRCDVGFAHDWADSLGSVTDGSWEQKVLTFSAKDAVIKRAAAVEACLQRDPQIPNQWLVSCGQPHMYEETGGFAKLERLDSYPPSNQLRRASDQCRDGLSAREQTPAFGVTAAWQPSKDFPGYIAELVGV